MSTLFIGRDVITSDNLRAAVDAALANWDSGFDQESLGEYLAISLDSEFGKRLDTLEEKLDLALTMIGNLSATE